MVILIWTDRSVLRSLERGGFSGLRFRFSLSHLAMAPAIRAIQETDFFMGSDDENNDDDESSWDDLKAEQAAVCFFGIEGLVVLDDYWMFFFGYCRQWSKLVVLYLVS